MIADQKKALRKHIKVLKQNVPLASKRLKSDRIFKELETLPVFIDANVILLYWSMSDEVQTHAFIEKWYREKIILLPAVHGLNMDLRVYSGTDSLVVGEAYGIEEPTGELLTDYGKIDLAIIPGIAFNSSCYRMGRGKGYYDRFLANYLGVKIGVCFDFQMVDYVPIESHDIPMHQILWG